MVIDEKTAIATDIINRAAGRYTVALAESCTGGMVAAALTDIAGSSAVFDRGFVTYTNAAKIDLLGVQDATLNVHGAVSRQTAEEMVKGTLATAPSADIAVSITGIAGPTGGTAEKPVGLVHFASQMRGSPVISAHHIFKGDRGAIRYAAMMTALAMIADHL